MKISFPYHRHPAAHLRTVATPLRWRTAWYTDPLWIWSAAMLGSPLACAVAAMLYVDPRCDHPLFWWGLPAAIAASNLCAVTHLRQRLHAVAPPSRLAVMQLYCGVTLPLTTLLILLLGWGSGFWIEMMPLFTRDLLHFAAPLSSTTAAGLASALLSLVAHAPFALPLPWLVMTSDGARGHADAG